MNSKFGNLTRWALHVLSGKEAFNQFNLNRLDDGVPKGASSLGWGASGFKHEDDHELKN